MVGQAGKNECYLRVTLSFFGDAIGHGKRTEDVCYKLWGAAGGCWQRCSGFTVTHGPYRHANEHIVM